MRERGGRFFVMYGQTEATARIAVLPPEALAEKPGSVGKPIPGGKLTIESEGRVVTEPFVEGELIYDGPNVMAGYANCPEDLARGAELSAGLHTGDVGYFDRDGFYYITGRNKRYSKVLGLRINLDEVETMLKIHGPTAVLAGSEQLLIYCEYGDEPAFADYARQLGDKLKLHPSLITFRRIESIPLNSNGKPDYQRLASA
jgi:acyl-CoA synthetase (AMP-forming)/AMP-acid ligase II